MQSKEMLLVAGGAILLTNLSIVGTLFVTGQWSDDKAIKPEPTKKHLTSPPEAPPLPQIKSTRHSMADAMYQCEDRLNTSNGSQHGSYQFNTVASRYSEEEDVYRVFIEIQTTSRASAPQKTSEVTCEVSAQDLKILTYSMMER